MQLSSHNQAPFRIGLLLIDGFALLSYASFTEPLRVANLLSGQILYEVQPLPASGSVAFSSGGVEVPALASPGSQVNYDLVMVVAAGDPFSFSDPAIDQWLNHLQHRGIALGGVSGGPVILAGAGVMEGYRLTLHWEHAAALCERYPALPVERSLYVIDRERMTCAGGTAPLDLTHALIMRQHGVALARQVSDWLQHTDVRPSTSAQRAGIVERYNVYNAAVLNTIEMMETHLADPLDLKSLAALAGVGERQLIRLFDKHLGKSPMVFYRNLRLERARTLLQQSALSVGEIARILGFATMAHFSARYRARYQIAPSAERQPIDGLKSDP